MKNIKVGILTFHKALNYGAVLQCYALQKKLNNLGIDAEVINYYSKPVYNHDNPFRIKNFDNRFNGMIVVLKRIIKFKKTISKKSNFNNFIIKNIKLSKKYKSRKSIKNISEKYNYLVSGSDQVWNAVITREDADIYNLSYFNNEVKKVSYAASIGEDFPLAENVDIINSALSDYHYISVREETAKKLLKNDKIEIVLDPTFLLTGEEWKKAIDHLDKKEKYILVYILEINQTMIEAVNTLSKILKLNVIKISSIQNPLFEKEINSKSDTSPEEFLNLFINADYVVTNSFHGLCFSLIFNKEFMSILHTNRSKRQEDLLKKVGLADRIYKGKKSVEAIVSNKINYKNTNEIIEKERNKAIKFIEKAFSDGNE